MEERTEERTEERSVAGGYLRLVSGLDCFARVAVASIGGIRFLEIPTGNR